MGRDCLGLPQLVTDQIFFGVHSHIDNDDFEQSTDFSQYPRNLDHLAFR